MQRRTFILGSGAVALAVAGVGSKTAAEAVPSDQLPDAGAAALAMIPEAEDDGMAYPALFHRDLREMDDPEELGYEFRPLAELDVPLEEVDAATALHTFDGGQVGVATGSFDRVEQGEAIEDGDEWWIGHVDDWATIASADGQLAFAGRAEEAFRTSWLETVTELPDGEATPLIEAHDTLESLIEAVGDHLLIHALLEPDEMYLLDDAETPEALATGFDERPADRVGEVTDVWSMAPGDAELDEAAITDVIESLAQGEVTELDVTDGDDIVVAEATIDLPPQRDRDAGPEAHFSIDHDVETGTTTIRNDGPEPVPAERLELWVNGERAGDHSADEFDEIEQGDELTVDVGAVGNVILRWIDEDETVYAPYLDRAVGREAVEPTYDPSDEAVHLEYVAAESTPADRLAIEVHRPDSQPESETVEIEDELTPGDVFTVDDVPLNASVQVTLDIPDDPAAGITPNTYLLSFRPRAPRMHIRRSAEEPPTVHYHHDEAFDADGFTVYYDGEPAEVQLDDDVSMLEPGANVELAPAEFGTEIEVTWDAPPESHTVTEHVVTPELFLEFEEIDETTLRIEHNRGEAVDVDNLNVVAAYGGETNELSDQEGTFAEGDVATVDVPLFDRITLQWRDGEAVDSYGGVVTGHGRFEGTYDPEDETVAITYTGEVEADPDRVGLFRDRWDHTEAPERPFAAETDVLQPEDTVTVDAPDPAERLILVVANDSEEAADDRGSASDRADDVAVDEDVVSLRPIDVLWEFQPLPERAFRFDAEPGTVTIEFGGDDTRDASAFAIRHEGEEAAVQFDDEFDELERGDAVTVEDVEAGDEIRVYWTVPDDPMLTDSYTMPPVADFAVDFDSDAGELTLTHEGGDPLRGDALEIWFEPPEGAPVIWDGDGEEVSDGDERTIEVEEEIVYVFVVYDGSEIIHEEPIEA